MIVCARRSTSVFVETALDDLPFFASWIRTEARCPTASEGAFSVAFRPDLDSFFDSVSVRPRACPDVLNVTDCGDWSPVSSFFHKTFAV